MSRPAERTARVARQTRLSGLVASRPSSVRLSGSVYGNSAIAGIPSASASSAAATTRSTVMRSTPGIDAMGRRLLRPSITNSGQIRSAGDRVFSATRRRDHADWRMRRGRMDGYWPGLPAGLAPAATDWTVSERCLMGPARVRGFQQADFPTLCTHWQARHAKLRKPRLPSSSRICSTAAMPVCPGTRTGRDHE